MSRDKRENDCSDDEFEFDEEYFSRTYRPLSNLPTPPPSSRNTSTARSPKGIIGDGELLDSSLLGPAVHLVNLIPPTASLATPSIPAVHEILTRANLPLETVALAVCILDSLDSKFSLNWRLVCPLAPFQTSPAYDKRHTIPATILPYDQLHIDSVRPELIVIASLAIAVKFLEDFQQPTSYYRSCWGKDLWTCEQINVTERCIMERLGYRVLPLWDRDLIEGALGDMRRATQHAAMCRTLSKDTEEPHKRSMSSGEAVSGLGMQLTPAETPRSEEETSSPVSDWFGKEARAAFMDESNILVHPSFHLPSQARPESPSLGDARDFRAIST